MRIFIFGGFREKWCIVYYLRADRGVFVLCYSFSMRQIYENENSNKFTEIFSENWEKFLLAYPDFDNPHVNRQIQRMMNCSEPQFGFKQYMCTDCGLFLERRYTKGFVGNISEKKAPKVRKALLRYLGKYLCRPQISKKRSLVS